MKRSIVLALLVGVALAGFTAAARGASSVTGGGVYVKVETDSVAEPLGWMYFACYRATPTGLQLVSQQYTYAPPPSRVNTISLGTDPTDGWYLFVVYDCTYNTMDYFYMYLYAVAVAP